MAPDEVATKMIFQEQYITLCQHISSHANGFTKVAEDPEPLSANNDPEGQESHKQLHQSRGRPRELYDVHSAQEQLPMTLFMALS
jgi:hypothetical protein